MPVIPEAPDMFTVPGLSMEFARWTFRSDTDLYTLDGQIGLPDGDTVAVTLFFQGPDLDVTGSLWTWLGTDPAQPRLVPSKIRRDFEDSSRLKLAECLRDGTWQQKQP